MLNWFKNWWSWTINLLSNERGDIGQMFSVPKSKSPWEAMTRGSSGGKTGQVLDMILGGGPVMSGITNLATTGKWMGDPSKGWANKYARGSRLVL